MLFLTFFSYNYKSYNLNYETARDVFPKIEFKVAYCLTVIGCNFVFNDLLHQALISNNGPWFTFPFMHIWWHHQILGEILFFDNSLFLKNWNHLSNTNFASSISMIISKKTTLAFGDYCFCFPVIGLFVKKTALFINILNKNSLFW